ncbi:MAG: NADH-quinone oxidoreductase subunit N [Candidatus Dasytiphilus stammeri]
MKVIVALPFIMPLIVLVFTSISLLIAIIIWKRNNLVSIVSFIGLSIATILSMVFFKSTQTKPEFVTTLLYIDSYSLFIITLVLLASLITSIFSYLWLYFSNLADQGEIFLLILIATLGGVLLASTNNLSSFFIGIELMAVPLFGLTGYTYNKITYLESSIKYTLLSAVTSSFMLFGIALIYAQTGSLNYSEITTFMNNNIQPLLLLGFGLMMTSIGFKLSLVPFHQWTAEIYQKAPIPAVLFLTTSNKIAIFGATSRLLVNLHLIDNKVVYILLSIMAFISIFMGNVMAFFQLNIKKLLAYSSIAHFGYLWIALICAPTNKSLSLETINISLISYLLSNLGLFGIIILISSIYHSNDYMDDIRSYRGLFLHHPILSLAMTVMIISLSGIPLTLGFISKFYILIMSIMSHSWWLSLSILIGSIMGIYYYLRLIAYLYLSSPQPLDKPIMLSSSKFHWKGDFCWGIGEAIIVCIAIFICILGILPQYLINLTLIH